MFGMLLLALKLNMLFKKTMAGWLQCQDVCFTVWCCEIKQLANASVLSLRKGGDSSSVLLVR